MKRKTTQTLFKQCEHQRTVFTIPTYKNISVLWIKSRAEVLQDLRKMKYLKQGGDGGISGGDLPVGTEGGQDAVRDRKFKLPQTGGFGPEFRELRNRCCRFPGTRQMAVQPS